MISRRLLRIKALMALYAFNRREDENLTQAEAELMFSIGKTYDLVHDAQRIPQATFTFLSDEL